MNKLLALLVLAALLLLADRGAAAYAEQALAAQLQRSGGLAAEPAVEVGGFPFLTQAVRGRYDRLEVRATGVPAGETVLAELEAVLTGARVPLSDALSGTVTSVPVDRVRSRVRVSYADLVQRSGARRLTVEPAGEQLRVRGELVVLGRRLTASALSTVTLDAGDVVVRAQSFDVGNGLADAALTRALGDRLDLRVPLRELPYGLVLESVAVEPDGLVLEAGATDTVLTTG